ncbi:MAG TPA: TRAP transporter large permease, partial [Planctomycetota bacterium]|nr:TRAP transporter large permease [Planctomycetota bacterium]
LDPANTRPIVDKMMQVALNFGTLAEQDPIIAIPLFTLAGTIMTHGGISARLVAVARALVGWLPGGLGMACVGACTLFAAISGSSAVTIIAIGGLVYPALRKEQFSDSFSLGLITSCGAIGILIPPSLPLIVYGVVASNATANASLKPQIADLFQAGLIPSLLSVLVLCAYCSAVAVARKIPAERFSFGQLLATLKRGFFALALIAILLGGIYGGYTTATEASAVACIYALIVELLIHREIGLEDLLKIGTETVTLVGVILMVLVSALALTNYLEVQKIPDIATDRMQWDQLTVRAERFSDADFEQVDVRVCVLAELPGGGIRIRPLTSSATADVAAAGIGKREKYEERIVGRVRAQGDDLVVDVKEPADWDGARVVYVPKTAVVQQVGPLVHSKLGLLLVVNLLLLVVGSVMDIYSGIVVIAPLIVPMAVAYHVSLVHLGIIFVLNLELGLAHPPLGINLFIAQSYFRKSIMEVTVAAIPFLLLLLGVLGAVTYWEPLSLFLVQHAPKAGG